MRCPVRQRQRRFRGDGSNRPFYSTKLVHGRTLQPVLSAVHGGKEAVLIVMLCALRKDVTEGASAHVVALKSHDLKIQPVGASASQKRL
jgi:hypothetical protein